MQRKYIYFCLIVLFFSCTHFDSKENQKSSALFAYDRIHQFMCKKQISESAEFLDSVSQETDKYILHAYLLLYSSDSTQIISMLDSAWAIKGRDDSDPTLNYKRYVMSAVIMASENVGDFVRAMEYTEKAINVCKKDSSIGSYCETYNLLGLINFQKGNIVESIRAYRNCLENLKIENNKTEEIQAYIGMASLFHKWSRKKIELEYACRAAKLANEMKDNEAYLSCNVARIAGIAYEDNNEIDSALYYYRQAYQISVITGMTYYAELLKNNILILQEPYREYPIHEGQAHAIESNKELRNMIKTQVQELKSSNDILKSDLSHESFRSKALLCICIILTFLIFGIIAYLKYYQHNIKTRTMESESRIKTIEATLENQTINSYLAEQDTGRFIQHFCLKYTSFLPTLQQKSPSITKNDLILCALIALGENNDAIQEIRHISKESLWAARYRIRTKLKLSHEENLDDFLRNLIT